MSVEFVPYPFKAEGHAASLPSLRDGVESRRHPVVVVGPIRQDLEDPPFQAQEQMVGPHLIDHVGGSVCVRG